MAGRIPQAAGALAALLLTLGATATAARAGTPTFDGGRLIDSGTREIGIEAGDFDEDGWDDVVTANSNGTAGLRLNRQDNWFSGAAGWPKSSTGNNQSVVTGDFNGDDHLDAAIPGSDNGLIRVFLGDGTGGTISTLPFSAGASSQPFDVATGDLNGDGALDLATANQANTSPASVPTVTVRFNTGSGGFAGGDLYAASESAGALTRGIAIGDVDGDGDADVVVVNTNANQVRILRNDGSGVLSLQATAYATTAGPRKLVLADLDGDSDLDIATADSGDGVPVNPANRNNRTTVLLNDGAGAFTAAPGSPFTTGPAQSAPFAVEAADLDGDGALDLAFANRYGGSLSVLPGNGDGTFGSSLALPYPDDYFDAEVTDLTVIDVNRDDRPDLMGNASGSPGYLVPFLNTTTVAAPDVTARTPASPGNVAPRIIGTTEGAWVDVFDTSDCSGDPVGTGSAADFEGPGIQVDTPTDGPHTYSARARNFVGWATSECSASSVDYTYDSTAPDAPTALATDPASPAPELQPVLRGTAESGSQVTVYATADCSGSAIASGSADDFGFGGFGLVVDPDTHYDLTATATDEAGNTSACSDAIEYRAPTPVNDVRPAVTGTLQPGEVLTASDGDWSNDPTSFSYRWRSCDAGGSGCTDVGADMPTYDVTTGDVGRTIRVVVTATNGAGSTGATSRQTARVGRPVPDAPRPAISGTLQIGEILTATPGGWSGAAADDLEYAWRSCDAAGASCTTVLDGDHVGTYTVQAADLGRRIRVAVTASNAGGSASQTSAATARVGRPVPGTPRPSISGTLQAGETVSAGYGGWDGGPVDDYAFQWRRCDELGQACTDVGTDADEYELTDDDVAHTLRVVVTATNAAGSASATSPQTARVGRPVNVLAPSISGPARVGRTLTGDLGQWNGADVTFSSVWRRCDADGAGCTDIPGTEDDGTYEPGAGDVGGRVRFVVTATNPSGSRQAISRASKVIAG